jgi:hypothetical protein
MFIKTFTKQNSPDEVIYFDTEQIDFELKKIVYNISKLCGKEIQPYLMLPYRADERLSFILNIIRQVKNSFIVIDGIRDLVLSINSEEEAINIVQEFKTLALERNNHIQCVIHVNPTDNNTKARGWLGTEVMNKSEAVILIAKDKDNSFVSKVHSEYLRDRDFGDFYIGFDEDSVPMITNYKSESDAF